MVRLDPGSPVPPFQQVRDQIAAAIEDGRLLPAVRLPTVRELAGDLGLAVNTVARSYRELELAGLLETRGRHGTYVARRSSPTAKLAAREARQLSGACVPSGSGTRKPWPSPAGRLSSSSHGARPDRRIPDRPDRAVSALA